MKYKPGDIAYIIANNRFIKKVEIMHITPDGFATMRFLDHNGYIRLRENRLFPTKEAAEAKLPKKAVPS